MKYIVKKVYKRYYIAFLYRIYVFIKVLFNTCICNFFSNFVRCVNKCLKIVLNDCTTCLKYILAFSFTSYD